VWEVGGAIVGQPRVPPFYWRPRSARSMLFFLYKRINGYTIEFRILDTEFYAMESRNVEND
jgi:hypothetical protein